MKISQLASFIVIGILVFFSDVTLAQSYEISSNGTEVTDKKTGLIWQRCIEGMAWDGLTCSGTASTYNHELALLRAKSQVGRGAPDTPWRLPNIKELSSIADKNFGSTSIIDPVVFPATPRGAFWSSTPNVFVSTYALILDFSDGYVGSRIRVDTNYVRLVRSRL